MEISNTQSARGPINVLFLCTGNSARSIIAEAILNRIGSPRFRACSAGSHPKGNVHPETLRLLNALGCETSGLRSKSWDEFTHGTAFDHVITVCNDAAGEVCPAFLGKPTRIHWDIPDPSSASATRAQMEDAFCRTYDMLSERISTFVQTSEIRLSPQQNS